jgi:hypothetical protein
MVFVFCPLKREYKYIGIGARKRPNIQFCPVISARSFEGCIKIKLNVKTMKLNCCISFGF